MGVEPAPADHVAAGRRQRHLAATREQGAGEQDRGADPRAEVRIEIGRANILGVDREAVATAPFGGGPDRADQFHQRFGIANARNVFQRDRMFAEQGGRHDRQRGVLVAGRLDGAPQPVAALNDVLNGRHRCPVFRRFMIVRAYLKPSMNINSGDAAALRRLPQISMVADSELSWMNSRRGSTTSPISLVKMSSASSTSLTFTCMSVRASVSRVVSQSWSAFISPRPL